ncbi:MAG TPA: vanadium-dependent haloperoxidase [Steroidobacteraceae bacterium]|nr:vanadium-dependent haloperoxidase [Steroidobacteraceae bacterium]
MKIRCKWAIGAALLLNGVAWSAQQAPDNRADAAVVVEWNQRLLTAAEAEDGFLTLKGVRAAAMMHLAMHDALNAVHREYAAYAFEGSAPDVDPVAAASQAAYEIAANQYPRQTAQWTELRDRTGAPREDAAQLGKAAAAAVLARRKDDKWDQQAEYRFHSMGPGVYAEFREHSGTPEGFVFGAGWATAKPFMLSRPDQFRVGPPPAIDSAEYARAFAEVKEVGSFDSRTRTADQAHLAMWWKEFVESSHNRLARELVVSDRLELRRAARLFALLNMAIFDGYVSVFDSKFFYNHWRPYTAIRWADQDGNPATEVDGQWDNLHRHTYAFPSYPSAHGTVCSAAMSVMADTFGERRKFTMETREVDKAGPMSGKIKMDPPTRSFGSFPAAALECSLSRVYLGIHFRYDSLGGNALGNAVGRYAVEKFLAPAGRASAR